MVMPCPSFWTAAPAPNIGALEGRRRRGQRGWVVGFYRGDGYFSHEFKVGDDHSMSFPYFIGITLT